MPGCGMELTRFQINYLRWRHDAMPLLDRIWQANHDILQD